ncbi:hypothetical protein HMPREF2892_08065 [Aerococcus sp. HMSC061A03]|uniref:hypothetical protein n=1 Tax=Aerococcus sp. HMSC061A03 TaxID=1739396 RepID=UPI0008A43228|nr:hypothetical protein [Aerococcus sp. HMSC061A03]OFR32558.1 hypothetical protein HMPREF2892_08065 [Aerococcus sp. HMSC061A03]
MLNDFKIYIANSFTCSSQTQVEIFNTIKEFYPFLIVENNNFRRSVRNYLISLEQKNQKQTINKKISALRKFQSYVQQASKSGEYSEIYFSIKYRKCFRLPKFYSLETINQINLLIHNLELSIFWKIILSLLTNHGAKISELQDIKFHHIDWLQGTINVSNRLFFFIKF